MLFFSIGSACIYVVDMLEVQEHKENLFQFKSAIFLSVSSCVSSIAPVAELLSDLATQEARTGIRQGCKRSAM